MIITDDFAKIISLGHILSIHFSIFFPSLCRSLLLMTGELPCYDRLYFLYNFGFIDFKDLTFLSACWQE